MLPDGGKAKKESCLEYFCSYPRGITPIASFLLKKDFNSVFHDNGMRGRVGNAFAVSALAAFGQIERIAETQGIADIYYFLEEGPGAPAAEKALVKAGRKVTRVTKYNEPVTDVADAIAHEFFHLRDDAHKDIQRSRIPLDLLIKDTQYKFIEIRKGALEDLLATAKHW